MPPPPTVTAPPAERAPTKPGNSGGRRRQRLRLREAGLGWLLLLPSVVVFALFVFWPLGRTLYLSVYGNDIFGAPSAYVGAAHYQEMLSAEFGRVLATTALFTLFSVLPAVAGALVVVLLLEARIRGVRVLRTAFALPFAFSVATASVVFAVIYNPAIGVANGLLGAFGIDRVNWLTDPSIALPAVCAATVWMNFGYNVLVLSAGVAAIPPEVVEAARLDGATGWRLASRITVPLLSPQLFFLVVVSTIHALQSFGQIHILTKGGPDQATTTLVYSIYEKAFAFGSADFGAASAQAVVLLVIMLACTAVQFGILERRVHYR
ncbi:sugar ABC transporter permease [Micromonospora sp. DR5-3]|uniref:carbohydrate ABC transporter permease n=1 Tax=unclassified Micromonospora TaxID=2617518 RepID=UPI0011D97307|nr:MULTISPECIES: sugar ABC transporter permease [unclassified Micromonospora]MCW3816140.1 sugar ABC transporter permease [Micromonospora sp. DR5-3]TYC19234.1 sugar ABC transporter permease [Micromonospora sp. MP36]